MASNVERAFSPNPFTVDEEPPAVEIEVGEEPAIEDIEQPAAHDDNLAEYMDEGDLHELANELIESVKADEQTRSEWMEAYKNGLDYLGIKIENRDEPWEGACGVFHPILSEAVVRFQSNAIMELFPASGPVRAHIVGEETREKQAQSQRKQEEMNYLLTTKMSEYRNETEQLLFRLPLAGSVFRKVYYDPIRGRPCAMMVPCEDFIVPYGASDLETCERYTHVMRKSENEITKLQAVGFYRDVPLTGSYPETTTITEKHDDLQGQHPSFTDDDRHVLYEVHADLTLLDDDVPSPYIVTVDKTSGTVLSVYRNWREKDPKRFKILHFVPFNYLPSLGFYGFGLIHLMGGIAKSATSILRQLVDAGTLSNLPGGLKARGFRVANDDQPIAPGEWRDVDISGQKISDSIFPLPYKEPSSVLYQLLTNLVEEGRRIGSVADIEVGEMNENSPVGTVLALLERSMKVMSAVHARLHASLKKEFGLISDIVHDYMPPRYEWDLEGKFDRVKDFDHRVDILPVSDPNAATQSAKIVQLQAVQQLAAQNPEIYDMKELHRQGLEAIGIKNPEKLIPEDDDPPQQDPVTENMSVLNGEPIKVYPEQDHQAHLDVHLAAIQDPTIMQLVEQSPRAGAITGAMEAHIAEHLAFRYRREIEEVMGTSMPALGEPLDPEVEVELSRLVAEASKRVLQKNKEKAAQAEAEERAQDPAFQLEQRKLDIEEAKVRGQLETDRKKVALDAAKEAVKEMLDRERMASQERQTAARVGAQVAVADENRDSAEKTAALKAATDFSKEMAKQRHDAKKEAQRKKSE